MKKNAKELMNALSSGPVQQYILEHENKDVRELVLKNKVLFSIPVAQLSDQIACRRKAKEKLRLYYETAGIIYPPSENFEQSSSQTTAEYKSELLAREIATENAICADLTGGFGVDAYFLSRKMKKVHYVEPQSSLLEIARHNHQLLRADNIDYHVTTAEDFLTSTTLTFDFIFIDPSRRPAAGKKMHTFQDSQPDILRLKEQIFERTTRMLIKASPLLDIQAGADQLKTVKKAFVVSVNNECKEVLFLCEKDFLGTLEMQAVNISGNTPAQRFAFTFPEERNEKVPYGDPEKYLYEPNASILKAGAFKTVATRFKLKKISPNTHLYTAPELIESFPGRIFAVEQFVRPEPKEVKMHFPHGKANVTTRNYPLTPEALKKKTGLKDGGEKFLIGFSGEKKKFLVVASRL